MDEPTARGIHLWYGDEQRVGHLGYVQHDFNLLGHVDPLLQSAAISYSLNGGRFKPLTTHVFRRIAAPGDFNVDLPVSTLSYGRNTIVIRATERDGTCHEREVIVYRERGGAYPLPTRIIWKDIRDLSAVGMVTDGRWAWDARGLRTLRPGYDRVFLIGNADWRDYELDTRRGLPIRENLW